MNIVNITFCTQHLRYCIRRPYTVWSSTPNRVDNYLDRLYQDAFLVRIVVIAIGKLTLRLGGYRSGRVDAHIRLGSFWIDAMSLERDEILITRMKCRTMFLMKSITIVDTCGKSLGAREDFMRINLSCE